MIASRLIDVLVALGVTASVLTAGVTPVAGQFQSAEGTTVEDGDVPVTTSSVRDTSSSLNETNTSTGQGCQAASTTQLNNTTQFLAAFANCTSVSYRNPPETAATATAAHFETLEPGDHSTSLYPQGANLTQTSRIADAHVTIHGAHPSTRVQTTQNNSTLLIAPAGVLRAFIDYRLTDTAVRTHRIDTVHLLHNETVIDEHQSATQTPQFRYSDLPPGPAVLTVEATIRVVYEETSASVSQTLSETNVTVVDQRRVVVTNVSRESIRIRQVRYDSEEMAIAVSHPYWNQLSVTSRTTESQPQTAHVATQASNNATVRVQNSWRFKIEPDESWTHLTTATAVEATSTRIETPPRYVHAVPTREGTTSLSAGSTSVGSADVLRWEEGPSQPSGDSQSSHHAVDANSPSTSGVTFRIRESDGERLLHVAGLVRGTNTSIDLRELPVEKSRRPNLSVSVLSQTESVAILSVRLRDPEGDAPIVVSDAEGAEASPSSGAGPVLVVNGQPVTTDENGHVAIVVNEYGPYSARFHPGPVTTTSGQPAYSDVTTTVSWHPLLTVAGVTTFATTLLKWLVFSLLLLYAGRRLGRFLHPGNQL
ncbi:hypothetical protein [Salinigranum halophilum]|uniref:hypothetical protein n=1 Tax=Salinigranum halophilum TaxID=2565931 RepID=UPI0010A8A068|nr:hypothetical protein [Salinigranum halophilum]